MNDLEEGFLKAYDTLESAKVLIETGFESGAVNRIYYAYFGQLEDYYFRKIFL